MRPLPFISAFLSILFLGACSSGDQLISSAGDMDDVYHPEKEQKTLAHNESERKHRVTSTASGGSSKDRKKKSTPDYYDPTVSQQLQWEQLRRRGSFYYGTDRYSGTHEFYRPSSYYGGNPYYKRRFYYYNNGGNNSSSGTQNSGNTGGQNDGASPEGDNGTNDSRDRSYDGSNTHRKR